DRRERIRLAAVPHEPHPLLLRIAEIGSTARILPPTGKPEMPDRLSSGSHPSDAGGTVARSRSTGKYVLSFLRPPSGSPARLHTCPLKKRKPPPISYPAQENSHACTRDSFSEPVIIITINILSTQANEPYDIGSRLYEPLYDLKVYPIYNL